MPTGHDKTSLPLSGRARVGVGLGFEGKEARRETLVSFRIVHRPQGPSGTLQGEG
jgi:hypothetical protein